MVSGETCAVKLSLQLPAAVAAEVEEVQRRDPEMLTRILTYGMLRRMMFDQLNTQERESRQD